MSTTFNAAYVISVGLGLLGGFLVHNAEPRTNSIIKFFVVPLTIAYLVLMVMNSMTPWVNSTGRSAKMYLEDKVYGDVNSMGYMQLFPPLFAVLLLFMILLYNGNLN